MSIGSSLLATCQRADVSRGRRPQETHDEDR